MTPRPWWMGRPLVWAWMVGLVLTTCWGLTPCPAQVAPLSVTLHAEAPCPAPGAESPLLRLPTGCPAPWAGVLYTDAEHTRTREQGAQVNALAKARGERADVAERSLVACRVQRAELTQQCVAAVARLEGEVRALSAVYAQPADNPPLWPWAALSGGLAVVGAGAGALADRGPGEVIGYGLAGTAVGMAVAWMVGRWAP